MRLLLAACRLRTFQVRGNVQKPKVPFFYKVGASNYLVPWPRESHPSVYVFDTRAGPWSGDKIVGARQKDYLLSCHRTAVYTWAYRYIYHAKY